MGFQQYLIFGISLLLAIFMQSCKKEIDYRVSLNFYYKNNSDVPVIVKMYSTKNNEVKLVNSANIVQQDSALILNYDTEGGKDQRVEDFDMFFEKNPVIDSIYIEFNSEKYQTYVLSEDKPHHPLHMDSYSANEVSNNKFIFTYTLTNADYDAANMLVK